jgi:hypothetical protein
MRLHWNARESAETTDPVRSASQFRDKVRDPPARIVGGPQNGSARCGVEETLLPSQGIEPRPSRPQS